MKMYNGLLALLPTLMIGCAVYRAKPLPTTPSLLHQIPQTVAEPRQSGTSLNPSHVMPAVGLALHDVEILAVANNPELRAARDERGVAASQLMAAGILPNPQLSGGLDHPFNVGPGYVNAFNLGLSYDVGSLITRSATIAAARSAKYKVDWSVLWQEWQVLQKARLLFIRSVAEVKEQIELQGYHNLLADRSQRTDRLMAQGNLTIDVVSANLVELQAVKGRLAELERRHNQTIHDLKTLLGLAPDASLVLIGNVDLPEINRGAARTLLEKLPRRRPDLLALQAGYESQEQQLRQTVLAQFPALNIGLTRARDTSNVHTYGFGITLTLPVFDRNQGNIAIAGATRQQLYDEYQARLNQAYGEANTLLDQYALIRQQYQQTLEALPQLERMVKAAETALADGDINFTAFAALRASLFEKRLETLSFEQTLCEQRAIIQTVLGADFQDDLETAHIQLIPKGTTP